MTNRRPQLTIKVPATATVGETVLIDPAGSTDPDGEIVGFSAGVLNGPLEPVGVVFTEPGEYEVFGRITDRGHLSDQATAIVVVTAAGPPVVIIEIAPAELPIMQVGAAVDLRLTASGGAGPYGFAIESGALPPGVTLAIDGRITGTPTAAGGFAVDIAATDANQISGTREYDGVVLDAVTPPPDEITITPATWPPMTVGQEVSINLVATGGGGGYVFRVGSGAMPDGVSLAIDGKVRGWPTTAGAYSVEVTATDVVGHVGAQLYSGTIAGDNVIPPPAGGTVVDADFEYLGALRLPTESAAGFQFAYGGIAGRKVNGRVRLFIAGDEINYHAPIQEFEVPAAPPSRDVATCPQMTRVRNWGDVYGGRRGTYMTAAGARSGLADLAAAADRELDPARLGRIHYFIENLRAWLAGRTKSDDAWDWYEFPVGMSGIAGLLWDEASRRLFWTYFDFYNVAGRPDWGLGASTLNDAAPEGDPASVSVDGPWRFACPVGGIPGEGWTAYGPWRGTGLIIRPDTGELVVSGSIMSGNAGSPFGPCAYGGGRLPAPGAPWDVDLAQPTCYLEHYPMIGKIDPDGRLLPGETLRAFRRRTDLPHWEYNGPDMAPLNINNEIYGYDSWRQVDGSSVALWIDELRGKSGLVYVATCCGTNVPGITGPGHEWYSNPGNDFKCPSHRIPAPVMITGPVSTGSFSVLMSYAIPDLLKVAAREVPDYSLEPAMFLNLQAKYNLAGASPVLMGGNNAIAGAYFDRDERLLYVMCPKADWYTIPAVGAPFFHVFRIGGAA